MSIALSFFTETSLSATFLLNIESLALVWDLLALSTFPIAGLPNNISCFVILPDLPVPLIWDISTSFSATSFLAAGLKKSDFELSVGFSFLDSGSITSLISFTAEVDFETPLAEVSIWHTTCPTWTTSPSSALRRITPDCSAGNSNVALSLSISAIIWSFSTYSPSETNHWAISTSEIDSPGDGICISKIIRLTFFFFKTCVLNRLLI